MSSEDINVEAGLQRDHTYRLWRLWLRFALVAAVVVFGSGTTCVLLRSAPEPKSREPLPCDEHPECSEWRGKANECLRWTL